MRGRRDFNRYPRLTGAGPPDQQKKDDFAIGKAVAFMKVWAHRGASAYAPENTLEAFELAIKMGADGVELDVHLSRDGEIVVAHDERVDRVSNGSGLIKEMTLSEIKELDFGVRFEAYRGAKAPTLREVYELLLPTRLTVNVELKTTDFDYPGIEQKCVDLAREMGMTQRVLYSSFNFESLDRVKAIDPSLEVGLLYGKPLEDVVQAVKAHRAQAVHPRYSLLYEAGMMDTLKAQGIWAHPWTVDQAADVKRLMDAGVEAVITNRPDMALEVRGG